jgi:hypothetical protein
MNSNNQKERNCVGGEHDWRSPPHTHRVLSPNEGATVIETDWCAVCGLIRVRTLENQHLQDERYEEYLPDWSALAERALRDRNAWKLLCTYAWLYVPPAVELLGLIRDHAPELQRYEVPGGLVCLVGNLVSGVIGVEERMHPWYGVYWCKDIVDAARKAAEAATAAYNTERG